MKIIIDDFFNKKYEVLRLYGKKYINKIGKKIEVDMLLSDCYAYLLEKDWVKTPTLNDLEGMSKMYIKNNIRWCNNTITKESFIGENTSTDYCYTTECDMRSGEWIENIVRDFYNELTREEKNIFNIYYYKNINSSKGISEYLDISLSYSYPIIRKGRELEERLRVYVKENWSE